jgi:hypothetical protein
MSAPTGHNWRYSYIQYCSAPFDRVTADNQVLPVKHTHTGLIWEHASHFIRPHFTFWNHFEVLSM